MEEEKAFATFKRIEGILYHGRIHGEVQLKTGSVLDGL
jgi:hypothetical protein